MSVDIRQGDARALDLSDESVDLIVTSPPYFGLRDYGTADQLGAELTPAEYVAELVKCTAEMMRVLKPSGSIFVNLGDKYGPNKSLRLLPERYRIACTDELDLIARAVLVWSKPNGLPESATDRVRRSHEDWVHLTKSPKYFAAVDEIREPHMFPNKSRTLGAKRTSPLEPGNTAMNRADRKTAANNPLGKLPGSVWEIATQPLRVPAELGIDHFAAFPMEWPRRLILGWSPREVCTACGEGRRPVTAATRYAYTASGEGHLGHRFEGSGGPVGGRGTIGNVRTDRTITGYACACPDTSAPSTPGVVLDPCGGTGTTALVADVLGRHGISVDLSEDYCRLARWRVNDPKQRERASRPAGAKPVRARRSPNEPQVQLGVGPVLVPAEVGVGALVGDVPALPGAGVHGAGDQLAVAVDGGDVGQGDDLLGHETTVSRCLRATVEDMAS